jgi:RNA polymerase sigma factor (sigma-70 family)
MEFEAKRTETSERLNPPQNGFTRETVSSFLEENLEAVSQGVRFAIKITGSPPLDRGEWEDLFQDGMLGVVKYLPEYDSNKCSLFTFIVNRAGWKILDEFRRMNPVSRTVVEKLKKMSGMETDEILKNAKNTNEYNAFYHALNPPVSLDSFYERLEGSSCSSDDCLVFDNVFDEKARNGHTRPVEDILNGYEILDTIQHLLDPESTTLNCREKIILKRRICGKTMLEIGRELGCSESRICQLTGKIEEKVHKKLDGEI